MKLAKWLRNKMDKTKQARKEDFVSELNSMTNEIRSRDGKTNTDLRKDHIMVKEIQSDVYSINEKMVRLADLSYLALAEMKDSIQRNDEKNSVVHRKIGEGLQNLNAKLGSYNQLIEEKNEELNKYKEGYRDKLNRTLFRELVRINEGVIEIEDIESMKEFVNSSIEQVLSDNDVLKDDVKVGDEFDSRVHRCIGVIETEDEKKKNTISEVVSEGFFVYDYPEHIKRLKIAEVKVFQLISLNEEEII